jgi:mevalonate kinase
MNVNAFIKSIELYDSQIYPDDTPITVEVVFNVSEEEGLASSAGVTVLLPRGNHTLQEIREKGFEAALEFLRHCQTAELHTKG